MLLAAVGRKYVVLQSDEVDMRFSDEKLSKFYDQFQKLAMQYEDRAKREDARFDAMLRAQEQNTASIKLLIDDTKDIVQLHKDLLGATRLGVSAQKFAFWCAKWGVIGLSLTAALNWSYDYIREVFK